MVCWHFKSTSLLSFTQKQPQHKEFLPYDFHIVLWTCNFLCSLWLFFLHFQDFGCFEKLIQKIQYKNEGLTIGRKCELVIWTLEKRMGKQKMLVCEIIVIIDIIFDYNHLCSPQTRYTISQQKINKISII
jgi:hypothetical protein